MTKAAIIAENKEIAKEYKQLLKISYRTLSAADKKLIRSAFDVAVDAKDCVYVLDTLQNTVRIFNRKGAVL